MNRRRYLGLLSVVATSTGCLRLQGPGATQTVADGTGSGSVDRRSSTEGERVQTDSAIDPTGTEAPSRTRTATSTPTDAAPPTDTKTPTATRSSAFELEQRWTGNGVIGAVITHDGAFYTQEYSRLVRYTPDGEGTWNTPRIGRDSPHGFREHVVVGESHVFAGTETDDAETSAGGQLRAYSLADGSLRWSLAGKDDGKHHRITHVTTTENGLVLGASQDHGMGDEQEPIVYAVDAATGDRQWTITDLPNGFVHDLVVHGERLYVAVSLDGLFAFDLISGEREAVYESFRTSFSGTALDGDVLYTSDNPVTAFDLGTRERLWESEVASNVKAGPIVADGRVFVGTETGHLVALDANTGEERWTARTLAKIRTEPTLWKDYVWVSDETGTVYAFDSADGGGGFELEPWDDLPISRPIGAVEETILIGGEPTKAFGIGSA